MKPNLFINKLTSSKINISLDPNTMKVYTLGIYNTKTYYKSTKYVCNLTYTTFGRYDDSEKKYMDNLPLNSCKKSSKYYGTDRYGFTLTFDGSEDNYIYHAFKKFTEKHQLYNEQVNDIIKTYINDLHTDEVKGGVADRIWCINLIKYLKEKLMDESYLKENTSPDVNKIIDELKKTNPDPYLLYMCINFKNILLGRSKRNKEKRRVIPENLDKSEMVPRNTSRHMAIPSRNIYYNSYGESDKRSVTKKTIRKYKYTMNNRRYVCSQYNPLSASNNKISTYLPLFVIDDGNYVITKKFYVTKNDILRLFFNTATPQHEGEYKLFRISNCKNNFSKRILGSLWSRSNKNYYANIIGRLSITRRYIEFIPGICNWVGRKIHVKTKFLKFYIDTWYNTIQ